MNMRAFLLLIFPLVAALLASCSDEYEPLPRRRAFPRIDMPRSVAYQTFTNGVCPFTFDYPAGGIISRDRTDSCWVDIDFPQYGCKWHVTYRDIPATRKPASYHFEEYRDLVYKHSKKASQIRAKAFDIDAGKVTMFEVFGNVGTPAQYFIVDSVEHNNVMLSFYFQTALKNDSLAPVITYMKDQTLHAMQTLKWR